MNIDIHKKEEICIASSDKIENTNLLRTQPVLFASANQETRGI